MSEMSIGNIHVHCPGSSGRSHWPKVVLGKVLVEQMDAKAITNALEFGDHVADVLDALHLFIQVVGLEEVTQMGVSIVAGRDMQLEQALVHRFLSSKAACIASNGL